MAVIAIEPVIREARLTERKRCLASRGEAISIAPYAVELDSQHISGIHVSRSEGTYDLVVTDDSHDAERLDTVILGPEGRARTLIAKDDVRVQVCIEIADAVVAHRVLERSLALARGIIRAVASMVVGAVAVNVHVVVLVVSLEEDGVGDIAAVDGAAAECARQSTSTAAILELLFSAFSFWI